VIDELTEPRRIRMQHYSPLTEPRRIRMQHYSPLSGLPDIPENYHHVTFELAPLDDGSRTLVTITQDGNTDQEAADHSAGNWQTVLEALQKVATAE
jgi:hypothetical protein